MVRIAVNGALGRMGQRILFLAQEKPAEYTIVQAFETDTNPMIGKDVSGVKLESLLPYADKKKKLFCDVLIDFSGPDGALHCNASANYSEIKGLVIGSTGLDEQAMLAFERTASRIAVVVSSNMSVGVNLVAELLELAARKLPDDFSVRVAEAHHIHKKDAPSGTALMLAKAIAHAKQWDIAELLKSWKAGKFDEKGSVDKIGMKVTRDGEIVGDHSVVFQGPAESVEIRHHAQSRDTFARGALVAAQFAAKKSSGLYTMQDVLKEN